MTTRSDLIAVLADIDATIGRVRDLSPHPSRSAALHSLATARGHLERMREGTPWQKHEPDQSELGDAKAYLKVSRQYERSPNHTVAPGENRQEPDSRPSSPPPENAVVRETASSAFRAARSILRQAKLLP